jgi:hypothetical protein
MESTVRQQVSFIEQYLKNYSKTNKMILRVLTFLFYLFLIPNHVSHLSTKYPSDFIVVSDDYEEVFFYLNNINSTIIFSHTAATEFRTTTSFSINGEIEIVCIHPAHIDVRHIKGSSWNSTPVYQYLIKIRRVANKRKRLQVIKDNSWLCKVSCYKNIFRQYKTKDKKSSNLVTHRFLTV